MRNLVALLLAISMAVAIRHWWVPLDTAIPFCTNIAQVNENKTYTSCVVPLDGDRVYVGCTFDHVTFMYEGKDPVHFYHNTVKPPAAIVSHSGAVFLSLIDPIITPPDFTGPPPSAAPSDSAPKEGQHEV